MRLRAHWPQIWLRSGGYLHLIAMGETLSNGMHVAYILATPEQPCIGIDDGTALNAKPQITRSGTTIRAFVPQEKSE